MLTKKMPVDFFNVKALLFYSFFIVHINLSNIDRHKNCLTNVILTANEHSNPRAWLYIILYL